MPALSRVKKVIQKVLLIRPPLQIEPSESKTLVFPLGLAYLGAVLEKEYQVKLLDSLAEGFQEEIRSDRGITYGLKPQQIREKIEEFSPDVIGISCLFSAQHSSFLKVAAVAKEAKPGVIVVMGGAHPSAFPEYVLKDASVDFVLIGEAEESFPHLLDVLKIGGDLSGVDGLAYKELDRIVINPKSSYIADLDTIPLPARHLLPMETYFGVSRPHGIDARYSRNTNLITSRGCPAGCVFCSIHTVFGRVYRKRSAENVLSEINFLKGRYGIREIQFEDDNLTCDGARAKSIFRGMANDELNIVWSAPNGIALWALDDELIGLMAKSGCWHAALGIESGDQEAIDKIIKKPLKLDIVKPLIEKMKRAGIRTTSFFVVGFPGESRKQIKNTLKFASSLPCDDLNIFFATPYPGTQLYSLVKEAVAFGPDFSLEELQAARPTIIPKDISMQQLQKEVYKTIIFFRLKRVIQRPHIFISRWIKRFVRDPRGSFLRTYRIFKGFLL